MDQVEVEVVEPRRGPCRPETQGKAFSVLSQPWSEFGN
jgi:hypothetical protein